MEGRPPGEFGLSKSVECDTFPFIALTLLTGWTMDRKGIRPTNAGRWFVGGDDLTAAFRVLWPQLSPPPPQSSSLAPIKSGIEPFWYRLTQVHQVHVERPLERRDGTRNLPKKHAHKL